MSARTAERAARLLPNGVPRWIRVYDNGGATVDRYTVVFTGRYRHMTDRQTWVVGMSARPFHPQGIGQHGEYDSPPDVNKSGFAPAIGRRNHLGKRITFAELPDDCRALVMQDYRELWSLDGAQ